MIDREKLLDGARVASEIRAEVAAGVEKFLAVPAFPAGRLGHGQIEYGFADPAAFGP